MTRNNSEKLPRQEAPGGWRPTYDVGRSYAITPETSPYTPTNSADALAYVREMALPEITAYDGYSGQAAMIEDEARALYPECFGLQKPATTQEPPLAAEQVGAVEEFYNQRRKSSGTIDWTAVARDTIYVVSSSSVQEEVTVPASWIPTQALGELTLID